MPIPKIEFRAFARHIKFIIILPFYEISVAFFSIIFYILNQMYKVFIDGKEGTTGLKIFERFKNRSDIELILIDEEKRKDNVARAECINASDFTFLCLPDAAAIQAVALCTNPETKIIDASTAHRTNPDWAYGFPELGAEFRQKIISSKRVAVPGCYASGFIALVYPLVRHGIISPDYPVVCHAVSGYSGAGKKPSRNTRLPSAILNWNPRGNTRSRRNTSICPK